MKYLDFLSPEHREEIKDLFENEVCLSTSITKEKTLIKFFDITFEYDKKLGVISYFQETEKKKNVLHLPLIPSKMQENISFDYAVNLIYSYLLKKQLFHFYSFHSVSQQTQNFIACSKASFAIAQTVFGTNFQILKKMVAKQIYASLDKDIFRKAVQLSGLETTITTYNWIIRNRDFVEKYFETDPGLVAFVYYRTKESEFIVNPDYKETEKTFLSWYTYKLPSSEFTQEEKEHFSVLRKLSFREFSTVHNSNLFEKIIELLAGVKAEKVSYSILKTISRSYTANILLVGNDTNKSLFSKVTALAFKQIDKSRKKKEFAKEYQERLNWFFKNHWRHLNANPEYIETFQSFKTWKELTEFYEESKRLKDLENQLVSSVIFTDNSNFVDTEDDEVCF